MTDLQFQILLERIDVLTEAVKALHKPRRAVEPKEVVTIEPMTRDKVVELLLEKGVPRSTAYRKIQKAVSSVTLARSRNGLYSGFVEV